MKSKLIGLMLIAGGSAFAESRFSIRIGGYGPGYDAPPPVYYAPARPRGSYRPDPRFDRGDSYERGWSGPGYWGEDPERRHQRAEWYGLRNHQLHEQYSYGDSPELREHQAEEQ